MTRDEFIAAVNSTLKLVRTEYGLTQDKMAVILGISKKTLVESEKGRRSLGWTETVALCSIFCRSTILQNTFGGDPNDVVSALAFKDTEITYPATMGGKIWWKTVKEKDGYKIQQNLISNHFRLLDGSDRRMISSFDLQEVEEYLNLVDQ